MFRVLMIALLLAGSALAMPALGADDPGKALHAFFEAEWERGLRESPESASYRGDRRYNDRWTDMGPEAIAARQAADRDALATLLSFDREALSAEDRLHFDVMRWQLEKAVERQQYREYLRPVNQRGGPQTIAQIAEVLPFASTRDYRDWLARMAALPERLEQVMALMAEGVREGNTPPRVLMERIPRRSPAGRGRSAQSQSYKPFLRFRTRCRIGTQRCRPRRGASSPGHRPVTGASASLFLRDYRCMRAVDRGRRHARRQALLRFLASPSPPPATTDEIHAIGLKEVARIRAEMEAIRREVRGDLQAFFEHPCTDPKFFTIRRRRCSSLSMISSGSTWSW